MHKPVISVYEQSVLRVGERKASFIFSKNHLNQLARVKQKMPASTYRLEYQSVRFGNLVGLIDLPEVIIEILPKIDRSSDLLHTRTRWTQLLQQFDHLPQLGNLNPQLLMQPGNLTETLQRIFLDEVTQLTHRGLTREYRTQQGQQSYMRGKLLLTEQIRTNLVHKHRFYVRSQSHQKNHYLNQRIKQALRIVAHSDNYRSQARNSLRHFQSVENLPLHAPETPIRLNRVNHYYQAPLRLANLICGGYLGGTFAGQDFGFSLLFDMSGVFELLVYYHLKALSAEYHFTLHYQPIQSFWKTKNLRPDFLIDFPNGQRLIIDTKWKILDRPEPSDDDLRQLYAYQQAFSAQRGVLLYPNVYGFPAVTQPFINSENQSMGEIQFVRILDDFTRQLKELLKISKC